jgi:uncharacterized phiE125 gp8 family phage protein
MSLVLVTPPDQEPVTVAEAKALLRYSDAQMDFSIQAALLTARQEIDGADGWLGRAILTQTWEMTLPAFPGGGIYMPLPPFQRIETFGYTDDLGVELPLDPTSYRVIGNGSSQPVWLQTYYSEAWPYGRKDFEALRIRFTCGWPSPEAVPQLIKTWIVARAGMILAQPESAVIGVSTTIVPVPYFEHMLASLKVWN